MNPYQGENLKSVLDQNDLKRLEVVNLVVNPYLGASVVEECAVLGVKNIFIQPGASSPELLAQCKQAGIQAQNGCVLMAQFS